jgi:hypothetical protein
MLNITSVDLQSGSSLNACDLVSHVAEAITSAVPWPGRTHRARKHERLPSGRKESSTTASAFRCCRLWNELRLQGLLEPSPISRSLCMHGAEHHRDGEAATCCVAIDNGAVDVGERDHARR